MRLVCPNCDAVYEVDASAIPHGGRDVQCSNCGTSWFQASPVAEAAAAEEAALFDAPPDDRPGDRPGDRPDGPAEAELPARSRGLDESVVAVLREEAEREAAVRRAEASQPIETQTEMGLIAAVSSAAATPAAQRIAMMKGADPDLRSARRPQTSRDMLPEIEEINSTLRATSERRTGEPAAVADGLASPRPAGNSFRNGFMLMLVVAAIAVLAYVMAPRIGQQIPGLAPGLESYVEVVNGARLWLDGVLKQAIAALRGLSNDQPA